MQGTEDRTKRLVILILAVVIGVIYLLSIFLAYPEFQDTRLVEPLAEINSLFPLYYLAIALTALLGFGCLIWRIASRYLHILLLEMFAVMLWFTPYYLTGFVRNPDGPWLVGVSGQMPQVLDGDPIVFSSYASTHPGSFLYHYTFLKIIDIEPTSYMTIVFPLLLVFLFVLLCYLFISRIFNQKVAFLSMLITIPGVHYIQAHPSPHTVGSLLLVTALLLLTWRGAGARIMAIIAISAAIMSHPESPLVLSIFLGAALLTSIAYSRRIGRTQVDLASMLLFCLIGWFLWYAFYPAGPLVVSWEERLESLYEYMIPMVSSVSGLVEEPFIYGSIRNLNTGVYALYGAAAILGILYIAARTYSQEKSISNWLSKVGGLTPGEAFMAVSVPVLILFSFLMAGITPGMVERGLTFIILAVSCFIASVTVRLYRSGMNRKFINSVVMLGLLFLTFSFPIVGYSTDAYSSIPASEGAGVEFLATEVPLEAKSIAMDWPYQIALHKTSDFKQTKFHVLSHPQEEAPDLTEIQPDLIVMRNTSYYAAAMRCDLSFDDNRYNEQLAFAESNEYDKIYSSPTFKVYSKDRE